MLRTSPDELPNRAFQLAYFLHRERKTAAEIASRALNKLQLAATAQGKRLYYRLTGRSDTRKARSKVSMGEPHLLQRLVYVESEEYERKKELAALNSQSANGVIPARHSDLVVYFIKHMVRITARRNSFYVTLGLSRLLYNYSTPETMELYNLIIQDPDRVHDDYYYRSRKGVLLKELKERFGELLEVSKGVRGEQRWRASDNGQRHHALVAECLRWFTPWATPCVVPERFDPLNDPIKPLNFEGRQPDEEHEVEVNRIHAALHPECFVRLTAANRLAPPAERLELPRFFLGDVEGDSDDGEDDSRTPPNLSKDELKLINDLLAQEAMRRKSASTGFLRVLVDGVQRAEINVERAALAQFHVDEDAELIEVYGSDQRGALLLATHLLNLNGPRTQSLAINTEGGQRISFSVNVLQDEDGPTGAQVAVRFKETAPARVAVSGMKDLWNSVFDAQQHSFAWWKPVAAFVVLALLFAGAWWVVTNRQHKEEVVRVAPTPPSPVVPNQAPVQSPASTPEKPTHNGPQVAPSPLLAKRDPAPRERDEAFVERSLLPGTGTNTEPDEVATRGVWNRELMGKPLNEVGKVYIQVLTNNASTSELQTELQARLADGKVRSTPVDQADAALKISVRKATVSAEDTRVIVTVRAVSANGYVVWPDTRRSSSWRYVGNPRFVADQIVNDLTRAIEAARAKGH